MPFFSIITASLNDSRTIGDTLSSVAGQSFTDLEHIVVDGGSIDNTPSVLEQYSRRYELRWISEPDDGISDALNKGVQASTGTYLLVLQADDKLAHQDVLQNAYVMLRAEKFDIYSFPVLVSLRNGTCKTHAPSALPRFRYHFKNIFRHQGTFIHRRVHDLVGFYHTDFSISMDYDLFYRAIQSGCSYALGREPMARMGGDGISRVQHFKRIREEARVQLKNERNPGWQVAQWLFRAFYLPYRYLRHKLEPQSARPSPTSL